MRLWKPELTLRKGKARLGANRPVRQTDRSVRYRYSEDTRTGEGRRGNRLRSPFSQVKETRTGL